MLQLWLTAASMLNIVWVHQRQHMPFSAQAASSGMRDVWMQTTQVLASVPCLRHGPPGEHPHVTGKQDTHVTQQLASSIQVPGHGCKHVNYSCMEWHENAMTLD